VSASTDPAVGVKAAVRRGLRHGKYFVGDHPALLPILLRATPEGTDKGITDRTELVIEGFPRSGNTFAVFAVKHAEGRPIDIASHVHHPAQVMLGVRKGLPTLVVIREPVGALASYLIAGAHGRPEAVLREYIRYHRTLLPYRDGFVVGRFEEVTKDLNVVIDRINARFGSSFRPFDQSPENVDAVFAAIEEHHLRTHPRQHAASVVPRPKGERDETNRRHVEALTSDALAPLLAEAREYHRIFTADLPDA
jgi:hypothetical protein